MPPDILRRGFSGLTLTTNDVRTLAHRLADAGELGIRANGARLLDVGQVDAVIAEDVVLDRLVLSARHGDDVVTFAYEHSGIVVTCEGDDPRLRAAYDAVVGQLAATPPNGLTSCLIDVSPRESWTAPPAAPASDRPSGRAPARRAGRWTRWLRALPGRRQSGSR